MASRILVRCKTDDMPGFTNDKIPLMANTACRKIWERDFDQEHDRLTTHGGYINPRCVLLIDHGPIDAMEYVITHLSWKEQELVEAGPVPKYIQKLLDTTYHFNPAMRPVPVSYTDEELEAMIGSEKFKKYATTRAEQLARFKSKTSTDEHTS